MFDNLAEDIEKRYWQKLAWMANRHNYTHGTSAKFSPASRPDKKPDYVSKSDSEYWISPMGVTRGSDHWGTVGSCDWKLGKNKFPKKKVYGFSAWENFKKDNKVEKSAASLIDADLNNKEHINALTRIMNEAHKHSVQAYRKDNVPMQDSRNRLSLTKKEIKDTFDNKYNKFKLLENEDGHIVGGAVYRKFNNKNDYHISDFGVLPKYRKQGYGEELLKELLNTKDMNTLSLMVAAGNTPAVNLYKKLGFKPYRMEMIKTSSAISDVDVSNWDSLSTEERNAIIKMMQPHTFAQLPGDRLGYGYEGSAYRGISPDFGEVTDDAPFNAVIKKFYGFEGEKPRFQARYEAAYNDPEVLADPEFAKFMQRKFEKPEIKALIQAGEMAKAEKLLRRMESGTWRHGTRKYNLLANPKNSNILARVIENAFDPSYEAYLDGSHSKIPQIGGLVMERLDIPDMGSLDEGEFKMLNQELANRIDTMHLGSDKGYGTKELDDRHEHANGEIGRSMVFRPMLKDRHGKKWIITDAHNAFTKEEANGMHNYWMHNMGMDNEGKLKIYDFMERKVK